MDKKGFYSKEEEKKVPSCEDCKMYGNCKSGKMPLLGKGKKGILIVGDYPTKKEDDLNKPLTSKPMEYVKDLLGLMDIDMEEDCWFSYAIRCKMPVVKGKTQIPSYTINTCRHLLLEDIKALKPKNIITLGSNALKTLIGHRTTGRANFTPFSKWVGWTIPDQELGAWLYPLEHPKDVLREYDHPVMERLFVEGLEKGVRIRPFIETQYDDNVFTTLNEAEAIEWLRMLRTKDKLAFDYETTGLKPYRDGHRILCVSFSDGMFAWSFPIFDSVEFHKALRMVLINPKIGKVAHNMSYERSWTKQMFGYYPSNFIFDPMLGAHVLDNRKSITNLKIQTYINFGILGYDDSLDKLMNAIKEGEDKKSGNRINRLDEADPKELCHYCGLDSLFTFKLYEAQRCSLDSDPILWNGYKLLHDATLTFSDMHINGIKINVDRLEENIKLLDNRMADLHEEIMADPVIQKWDGEEEFNYNSGQQLSHMLFDILGYVSKKETASGAPSTDKEALEDINEPFVKMMLERKKLDKLKTTYLLGIQREQVNGRINPSIMTHTVQSYRSCVAKGSLISVPKTKEYPNGMIPIEDVKVGQLVYTYDDDLNLRLKPVVWAGKTGTREVIRIHFRRGYGKKGYLDVTPEHKIRMWNGEYERAENLPIDNRVRDGKNWKYKPKCSVLSVSNCPTDERIHYTSNRMAVPLLEHRFVYEELTGNKIPGGYVIHHKDFDHHNNDINNLEMMLLEEHAGLHGSVVLSNPETQKKTYESRMNNIASGKITFKRGWENHNSLKYTKEECLQILESTNGCFRDTKHDFQAFKNNCIHHGITVGWYKLLYNHGKLITADMILENLNKYGWSDTYKKLGVGNSRLHELCDYYNINYWSIPHKKEYYAVINNHAVTSVEWIGDIVDVYDLEVQDTHCFVANEICVHNSSASPNLQNMAAHDKFATEMVLSTIEPTNDFIVAIDEKSLEVMIGACYHKDPQMLEFLRDENSDMHRTVSSKVFMCEMDEVTSEMRRVGKTINFASQYGSSAYNIAMTSWEKLFSPEMRAFVKKRGIKNFKMWAAHMEDVMKWYWEELFGVYGKWRDDNWKKYLETGYIKLKTGLKCRGVMRYTQAGNFSIQGSAANLVCFAATKINEYMKKNKLKTKLILYIHDSLEFDVVESEWGELKPVIHYWMTKGIQDNFPWVIAPLGLEAEYHYKNFNEVDKVEKWGMYNETNN